MPKIDGKYGKAFSEKDESMTDRLVRKLTYLNFHIAVPCSRTMQIFPKSIRKLWNEWQLPVMVLISLSLQIILIVLGNLRKSTASNRIRIVLWLTYLSADWVATVSLGVLCNSQGDSESVDNAYHPDSAIVAFWAPFLLVHLGGPDTITAFSLEDNELWLRHFLGLLVQVGVAFYVFLRSWTTGTYHVLSLAIPMFIAGVIKYGERTWAIRSASIVHFRDSLLPPPNPGLDYIEIVDKYGAVSPWLKSFTGYEGCRVDKNTIPEVRIFHEAYYFFNIFKRLYADLIFSFYEIEDSNAVVSKKSAEEAFSLIEVELGFIYDVLYTKASVVYSRVGIIFRLISFISCVSAFVSFLIIVNRHHFSGADITISYILLSGAIALEIYAIMLILFSDWTMLWLSKHNNRLLNRMYRGISSLRLAVNKNKRWSHSMGQYNLLEFCLKHQPTRYRGIQDSGFAANNLIRWSLSLEQYNLRQICLKHEKIRYPRIQNFFGIYGKLDFLGMYGKFEKYRQINFEDVSAELKEYIFHHIKQKAENLFGNECTTVKEMCSWRGNQVIEVFGAKSALSWSVEGEFDESILLWHIATNHCYYDPSFRVSLITNVTISKLLSDYMLYLLVTDPLMLPKGIGQIRFQDTVAEAVNFFAHTTQNDIKKLLRADSPFPEASLKRNVSKSVLFDGRKLADLLGSLERENGSSDIEWKWEMISDVWVEMLCYAANQCSWNQHAQHLARGGELITHVSLLMAHLGLTEQLKVSEKECITLMPPPMPPTNNCARQRQTNHWNPPDSDSASI